MTNLLHWCNESIVKKSIIYLRHSAEDKQENSVPIQRELIQKFAKENGIEIIHEEADEGKTGLLADRPGFQRLLQNWILNDNAPHFDYVLVFDVSRWGRFQNLNEPAHYQWLCEKRGKQVIYVSQGFPKKENADLTQIQLSFERIMAARYSKQLSDKVFHGCVFVSKQGFSAGGTACYGMGRQLLDENKQSLGILKKGQHKQISNQRVTFVPLNDETTKVVQNIFHLFVNEHRTLSQIAAMLNERGILSACGGQWNKDKIIRILINETYTGTRIYNKTWNRLREGKRDNPRSDWVIRRDAFPSIVDRNVFEQAQERLWFALRRWRENTWAMRKAKALILKATRGLLAREGVDQDELSMIDHTFPLVLSVSTRQADNLREWCFVLPEEKASHEFVVGVGVVPDRTNLADELFIIPIEHFGHGGICTFTEKDILYGRCAVTVEQLEQHILKLMGLERKTVAVAPAVTPATTIASLA